MSPRAVRIKARQQPSSTSRPFLVGLVVGFPGLGRFLVNQLMRLPHGRLRRAGIECVMREVAVGGINRSDFELIRAIAALDFELEAAPELLALQGRELWPIRGIEPAIEFLEEWLEGWGGFVVVPQEVIDLGDGRVVLLNSLVAQGATSGVEIGRHEEAEVWVWGKDGVRGGRQWWSWREALEAVGLCE